MKIEDVKRTVVDDDFVEYRENHPAFGQIVIHRVQHSGKFSLYGSASGHHMTTVTISISKSERSQHLSKDWYFGKEKIIEIEMTALQFADLLTNFNMASGVPCTIRHIKGEDIPDIPSEDNTEIGRITEAFDSEMKSKFSSEGILAAKKEINEILAKKNLLRADRIRLSRLTDGLLGEIEHNVPFVMQQYTKAVGKIESEVKKEVAALTQIIIERAGIKALSNMTPNEQGKLLTGEKDKKED